jgi:hypothetical protein
MNRLFASALRIQQVCDAEGWRSCVIGGLAVQRWGEPRLTQDVDVSLMTGFGTEQAFVDRLLEKFEGRRADARAFALQYRVLLLVDDDDVPVDVSLGAMPFEDRAITRASEYDIAGGIGLRTCSAEDLIVFKAFAGRPQDWLDIEGILDRQRGRLDIKLVWDELLPLLELKDDVETAERLRTLIKNQ